MKAASSVVSSTENPRSSASAFGFRAALSFPPPDRVALHRQEALGHVTCDAPIVIDSGCPSHMPGHIHHIREIDWLSPTPESIVVESIHILPLRHARLGNGTLCMRRDAKVRNGKLYFFQL